MVIRSFCNLQAVRLGLSLTAFGFLASLGASPSYAALERDEAPVLVSQREAVFNDLIRERLSYIQIGLYACENQTTGSKAAASELWNALKRNESAIESLERYRSIRQRCSTSVGRALLALEDERKKQFLFLKRQLTPQIVSELDPVCMKTSRRALNGQVESNTCFAGHRIALGLIRSAARFSDLLSMSEVLLQKITQTIESTVDGGKIDLWQIARNEFSGPQFLGWMATLRGSSHSFEGYMDPFTEILWLNASGQADSGVILSQFHEFKRGRDLFLDLMKWAESRSIEIFVNGVSFKGFNHHEAIASALSCHYQRGGHPLMARSVPKILSLVYESKDFIANTRDGMGLKESVQKIIRNAKRYDRGIQVGTALCLK